MTAARTHSPQITPEDVAKYFLIRSVEDGDLVSPLKMQKLVYYAYSWVLVKNKKKLFEENIEAWPNGPVIPSLYQQLKKYNAGPISVDYLGSETEIKDVMQKFQGDIAETLDDVYKEYMTKTAFELVVSTHAEKPWREAREGLSVTEHSNKPISDTTIIEQYGQQA